MTPARRFGVVSMAAAISFLPLWKKSSRRSGAHAGSDPPLVETWARPPGPGYGAT